MAGIEAEATGLGGVLRITWVADDLAHMLEHCHTKEPHRQRCRDNAQVLSDHSRNIFSLHWGG
jgi:hypothetical protein